MSVDLDRASLTVDDVAVGDAVPRLVLPVTARTVVQGAAASRDWQPQHHDHAWAMDKVGTDVFLNTPTQAGWIERYLTDWTGPLGRLGRLEFRMRRTVVPGDELVVDGIVTAVSTDTTGTGWVDVDVTMSVRDEDGEDVLATSCTARVALPTDAQPNPWACRGSGWRPDDAEEA